MRLQENGIERMVLNIARACDGCMYVNFVKGELICQSY